VPDGTGMIGFGSFIVAREEERSEFVPHYVVAFVRNAGQTENHMAMLNVDNSRIHLPLLGRGQSYSRCVGGSICFDWKVEGNERFDERPTTTKIKDRGSFSRTGHLPRDIC
jgi:hypothetical protein